MQKIPLFRVLDINTRFTDYSCLPLHNIILPLENKINMKA